MSSPTCRLKPLFGLMKLARGEEGLGNKNGQPGVRSRLGHSLTFHKDSLSLDGGGADVRESGMESQLSLLVMQAPSQVVELKG